jgi:hypothetical protein
VRGLRLRGSDLEGECPQGNEAGKLRQDGEDAFPVKGIRVRDENRRDIPREVAESGKGGRNGCEDVAPRWDPDVVGEEPKAGGAFDGAKKLVRRQATKIELRLERPEEMWAQGFIGYPGRRRDPGQRDAVIEADEDVSEVDEECAQKAGLFRGGRADRSGGRGRPCGDPSRSRSRERARRSGG